MRRTAPTSRKCETLSYASRAVACKFGEPGLAAILLLSAEVRCAKREAMINKGVAAMNHIASQGSRPALDSATSTALTPSMPRPRLAIVSTFDDLCGIAAYTRALVRQLGDCFDIKVFDLDQYLMRSPGARVRKEGDAAIRRMCDEFVGYDFVNIQLEHGTLGRRPADILRRFQLLVEAAPALTVTFHTVLQPDGPRLGQLLSPLLRLRFAGPATASMTSTGDISWFTGCTDPCGAHSAASRCASLSTHRRTCCS